MPKKLTRKELREHLYRMLFRIEFYENQELMHQQELYLEEIEQLQDADREEIQTKYRTIVDNIEQIDLEIGRKANGWSIRRLPKSDLTILRLAVYELLMDDNVPNSVAINEAIELAKQYGTEKSSSFVNGVLASIAKEQK